MKEISIEDLPPEILIEIFTYLPWYDRQQAALVCKLWQKIGQQQIFATQECLNFTHCNLNDDKIPGLLIIQSERDFYNIRIGKAAYVTRNSDKLFDKWGNSVRSLNLNDLTLEWEGGLLLKIIEQLKNLEALQVGGFLSEQINSRAFVDHIFSTNSLRQIEVHGVSETFVQHFLNHLRQQRPNTEETRISLYFNCGFENRDKFDAFFEQLALVNPDSKILELTVPFKLKALPLLTSTNYDFSHLEKLEITSPKSFQDLKKVCQLMPNLKELILWLGCLDFQLFDVFDSLSNLEMLRIQSGIRLTEASDLCDQLHVKPKLKIFEVELIEGQISVNGFERLIKCMPNLESLMLSQSDIGDEHLVIICDNLCLLKVLQIDFGKITDAGMSSANWKNLNHLQTLKLSGCHILTDAGFLSLPFFPHMKELRLNYITQISSGAIKIIVDACPSIEYLSLDGCSEIDDVAIELITTKLQRLHQLDIYSCTKVSKKVVEFFVQNCKRLQFLDLSAVNIDEDDKQELYKQVSSLRYIYDYDDGNDMSKYFKGRSLRKRELYLTTLF